MSQLIDNLNIIESVKTEIKTALENKGVDMTGVSFPGYASKIGEISGGGGWDQKSVTEGAIEIINLDNSASFVASSIFTNNKTIQTVNLPYATTVGYSAFYNCGSLTQVSLPMCSSIGNYAFYNCGSLTQVSLPVCRYIAGNYAFYNCGSLTQVSSSCNVGIIAGDAFDFVGHLIIITIGYSSVCVLAGSNTFLGTKYNLINRFNLCSYITCK